jgi:Na+-translocating ferredoxin:NAD+ oxidoreductase RnfD subunit
VSHITRSSRESRRLLRGRVVSAMLAFAMTLYVYGALSIAQALMAAAGKPVSCILAEWARAHTLGWW